MSASSRRPIVRWAWRLFQRDWRQQLLVIGLLVFAVAFVLYSNVAVSNALAVNEGEFGRAQAVVSFDATSAQQVADDVQALGEQFGETELIGHRSVPIQGADETLDFRAQQPDGELGSPMLTLRDGRYPAGTDEIALTDGAAALLRVRLGQELPFDGATRGIVGIVENPSKFDDEFALATPTGFEAQRVSVLTERQLHGRGELRATGTSYEMKGRGDNDTAAAAALTLLISAVLLLLIALVAAAGFATVAQRRLRQLGMLSAIGATDNHMRLVMVTNGTLVGAVSAAFGLVIAAALWLFTKSRFERLVGHEIPGLGVQWWAVGTGIALAVATSTAAAWWPARCTTRVSVASALSGRPPHPSPAQRSVRPALVLLAGGVVAMGAGVDITSGNANPWLLLGGALAVTVGILLFAPLAIRGAASIARRAPIPVRLALRDLSRYQARSGAALAAITLGLGLAVATVVIAAAAADSADEGNLASNQMLIRTRDDVIASEQLTQARADVEEVAAGLDATTLYSLDALIGDTPDAALKGGDPKPPMSLARRVGPRTSRFLTNLYAATPELLDRAGLIDDGSVDVFAVHTGSLRIEPLGRDAPIPRVEHYDAPEHGSAPTALMTPTGVARYGFERQPVGWLLEADRDFTAAEIAAAREIGASTGLSVEVRDEESGLLAARGIATGVGMLVALCLLALTIGLIRSEAGRDLQTLVAVGATSFTRRALTAVTSGALALLGSILAITGAYVALLAIYFDRPGDLAAVPVAELATLLFGLPLLAAGAGWILTGREPAVITRHALD